MDYLVFGFSYPAFSKPYHQCATIYSSPRARYQWFVTHTIHKYKHLHIEKYNKNKNVQIFLMSISWKDQQHLLFLVASDNL